MKNKLICLLIIATFLFFGCSKKHYPTIVELKKQGDKFSVIDHQMGQFLFGINPLEYSKNEISVKLKAILSYPGKDRYSSTFDTLYSGVGIIEIYYGKVRSGRINSLKKIGRTDCNGFFEVEFKREANCYLFFYNDGFNTTGFNSINYFESYDKAYKSSLLIMTNCK